MRVAALALVASLAVSPGAVDTHSVRVAAPMTGEQETTPGDPDGIGAGVFRLDAETGQVCYLLVGVKLDGNVTAAHIHRAPAGFAGPVVIGLTPPRDGVVKACTTAAPAVVQDIVDNSANYYVNVHTSVYPAGAIRAQLR